MPARKRRAAAKPAASKKAENESNSIQDDVQELVEQLEREVRERMDEVAARATELTQAVRVVFQMQLLKLPTQVRQMSLKEFTEQHSGNIDSVLLGDLEKRLEESITATTKSAHPLTTRRAGTQAKNRSKHVPETPAFAASLPSSQASTVMRAPKIGETFYSQNGSPIGVLKAQRGRQEGVLRSVLKGGAVAETPLFVPTKGPSTSFLNRPGSKTGVADGVVIELKDGSKITVSFNGGLEGVAKEHRIEVAAQLEALEKLARSALTTQRR